MRRSIALFLLTSMLPMVGCSSIPSREPGESKSFSKHLLDFIAYELRGGKTQEEYDRDQDAEAFKKREAEKEWERTRRAN